MSQETDLLDDIFGGGKFWKKKYRLKWCDHCEVWMIICPVCKINSCSGGGCTECSGSDYQDWRQTKHCFEQYLSEEEKVTAFRISYIKQHIPECLAAGFKEINWAWLNSVGHLCEKEYQIFPELEKFRYSRVFENMKTITAKELQIILAEDKGNSVDSINMDSLGTTTIIRKDGTFEVYATPSLRELSNEVINATRPG